MGKGAVGIGTLIIFIAMVLVAAIAAAVLISTSGILQQRAMTTGKESIQQVSSNIVVVSITGYANAAKDNVDNLTLAVSAAAGAGRIDLRYLIIRISNSQNESYLSYSSTLSAGNFTAEVIRDPSNLFTATNPVIDGSSLVRLTLLASSQSPVAINLVPREKLHIELIPEHGNTITIDTRTPESYSMSVINLYP